MTLSELVQRQGLGHVATTSLTGSGFIACADCWGPIPLNLEDLGEVCPECGWGGPVLAKTETDVWCIRCGHVWNLVTIVAMREAN